jgi:TetR/AcrR family transcriptional regulator, transcriptional repressor for nem operon
MAMAADGMDTATRILDSAERLVQSRGFNGFSYADVAAELGITKASLHYHFAGKAELGHALIERYCQRFAGALGDIDARGAAAPENLRAYAAIYTDVLRRERLCLCGMLAADYATLPPAMREVVVRFFDENERWVVALLDGGRADGALSFDGAPEEAARTLVGGLEGAMLIARPYGDLGRFEAAAERLLASVAGLGPVPIRAGRDG